MSVGAKPRVRSKAKPKARARPKSKARARPKERPRDPGMEQRGWSSTGVTVDEVVGEIARMNREHADLDHRHAFARSLNLVVAPCPANQQEWLTRQLQRLGERHPSRTIVLAEKKGGSQEIDAEVVLECEVSPGPEGVGICHDTVILSAGRRAIQHADSMVSPLLLVDLPNVLWMPQPKREVDRNLLERVQHIVVNTSRTKGALAATAKLARDYNVHDLAWGRLWWWRAAIAAAFEPAQRRSLVASIDRLEIGHDKGGERSALLLAGWIAAKLGWRAVTAPISLSEVADTGGPGGVESVRFVAGDDEVALERGSVGEDDHDPMAAAVHAAPGGEQGFAEAVAVAAKLES